MDRRLAAWARQVKARSKARDVRAVGVKAAAVKAGRGLPALWLFTDAARLPDPLPAIARLPRGCGVVFRHDGVPGRAALAAAAARLCRRRGLLMVVAGDPRLAAAVGAGLHLRGGRMGRPWRRRWLRPGQLVTSSAHDAPELVRAWRAGASAAFVSPLFPTLSHPGARPLGPVRWAALARRARGPVLALGGVSNATVGRVPPGTRGAGVIGAASGQPSSR
ncbi:MAG: thiamine phosphate synthase [Janthinobacterium lividum]